MPGKTPNLHTMCPSTLVSRLILVLLILVTNPAQAQGPAPKILNNLVKELVNFNFAASPEKDYLTKPYKVFSFEKERDGWIYITIDATLSKADRVWITLADDLSEKPVLSITSQMQTDKSRETMRFVKAGSYKIRIWNKGTPHVHSVIVRSIPEIIFYRVLFLRKAKHNYDFVQIYQWDYLTQNILDNYNVIVSNVDEEYHPYIAEWRKRGRKWLAAGGLSWADTVDGVYEEWGTLMENPLYDGIIIDEFGWSPKHFQKYPLWSETMKRIKNNPVCEDKMLYGFGPKSYYYPKLKELLKMLFEPGYKCVPEAYYIEKPTEIAAEQYLNESFTGIFTKWGKSFPGVVNNIIICLAPSNIPPLASWNTCPNVNFKVFVDKQFYYLANEPVFKNLYGVTLYTSSIMDEEILRWSTELVRHYLIEGNREMLGKDPYILTHLKNPGFEQGKAGWDFSPASNESIKVITVAEMKFKKQFEWNPIPEGNKILYTKRSSTKPNIISQKIKHLVSGRLYSLKVYNCDFVNFGDKKQIPTSIKLNGVEVLKEKSRDQVFSCSFPLAKGTQKKTKVCWNAHYRVFRAKSESGQLVLSDWKSDTTAGGPANQEIIWDFIELQPYFAIEEYENMNQGIH